MYDVAVRRRALAALGDGASLRSVSLDTGISRSTLRSWISRPQPVMRPSGCPFCSDAPHPNRYEYLYLLGMYLGDGCISPAARTTALRIACANSWPGVMNECHAAMGAVAQRPVYRVAGDGCSYVTTLWKHWPCLFPQHGRGVKHRRAISLAPWQQDLIAADPRPVIRGLLHSDGCRITNIVRRDIASGPRVYAYPRYFFSNMSDDIRCIFTDALDLLGIAWRQNRFNSISIARSEAVAALDEFVGPKA